MKSDKPKKQLLKLTRDAVSRPAGKASMNVRTNIRGGPNRRKHDFIGK